MGGCAKIGRRKVTSPGVEQERLNPGLTGR